MRDSSAVGAAAAVAPRPPVVTILGDSITAGFGLPAAEALPAQLQRALAARGVRDQMVIATKVRVAVSLRRGEALMRRG